MGVSGFTPVLAYRVRGSFVGLAWNTPFADCGLRRQIMGFEIPSDHSALSSAVVPFVALKREIASREDPVTFA